MKPGSDYVLGLHPCSRGFGWTLFEGPDSVFDWGTADIRQGDKNAGALRRADVLFARYRPRLLALEAFDGPGSRRKPRIRSLYRSLIRHAEKRGIAVRICARSEIKALFACSTREETAAEVAKRVPALASLLQRPRKIWEGEPSRLPLFCAAACALASHAAEQTERLPRGFRVFPGAPDRSGAPDKHRRTSWNQQRQDTASTTRSRAR